MEKLTHSFCSDVLSTQDAVGLAALIKKKEINPKEAVTATIERFQKVNPVLNGVAELDFERALQFAERPMAGCFAGIPSFVKDNTPVEGLSTNYGSAGLNTPPALAHGSFAKQFLTQGFVCLGKSQMPEFGFNATTEPSGKTPTRNPWNTDYSPGGSSGGAAALVAAGVVPIAHANDGGGSIRIPAACCGLVGLKPSRGRLVCADLVKRLPYNIVCEGVVTRSVRDTAQFYAEAEKYYRNRKLPEIGLIEKPINRRLKVGLVLDSITGHKTDQETRSVIEQTAKLMEDLGHHVETGVLPVDQQFAEDFSLFWGFLSFSMQHLGKFTLDSGFDKSKVDGLTIGLSKMFARQFYKFPFILQRLKKSYFAWSHVFQQFDVLLTPVLGTTPAKIGELSPDQPFDQLFQRLSDYACFTPIANAAGGPAISLPMGSTTEGVPIGVHFMADHGQEKMLLELAYELEQAKPWKTIYDSK